MRWSWFDRLLCRLTRHPQARRVPVKPERIGGRWFMATQWYCPTCGPLGDVEVGP